MYKLSIYTFSRNYILSKQKQNLKTASIYTFSRNYILSKEWISFGQFIDLHFQ